MYTVLHVSCVCVYQSEIQQLLLNAVISVLGYILPYE